MARFGYPATIEDEDTSLAAPLTRAVNAASGTFSGLNQPGARTLSRSLNPLPVRATRRINPDPNAEVAPVRQIGRVERSAQANQAAVNSFRTPLPDSGQRNPIVITHPHAKAIWDALQDTHQSIGVEGYNPVDHFQRTMAKYGVDQNASMSLIKGFQNLADNPNVNYLTPSERQAAKGPDGNMDYEKVDQANPFKRGNILPGYDTLNSQRRPASTQPAAGGNRFYTPEQKQQLEQNATISRAGNQAYAETKAQAYSQPIRAGEAAIDAIANNSGDPKLDLQRERESGLNTRQKNALNARLEQQQGKSQLDTNKLRADLFKFYQSNPSLITQSGGMFSADKKMSDEDVMGHVDKLLGAQGGTAQKSQGTGAAPSAPQSVPDHINPQTGETARYNPQSGKWELVQ